MEPLHGVVLTPHPGYRVGFVVTAVLFVAGALWNVPAVLDGTYAWTTTNLVGFPVVCLLAVTTTVAAASSLRHAVWVDADGLTLRMRMLVRTRAVPLTAPTTVTVRFKAPAPGSTLVGTQSVHVRRPGEPTAVVSTPWVPNVPVFLSLLGPALEHHPGLVPDEESRRVVEASIEARARHAG